ncbi:MAG: radical SAM protein, partial [Candidatus Omnitrophota bacterium]
GGPFLVSLAEVIMCNEPAFDYIVRGEGEITMRELLEALASEASDLSAIDGLVWRNAQGGVVQNKPRTLIEDLDILPFPARDLLEQARKDSRNNGLVDSVRMTTSRGCVGRCSFCCVNLYNKIQKGKGWRGRSPKKVVDELEILTNKFNARVFNFSDSSFEDPGEIGKVRSREICEEIIRRNIKLSAKIYMRCETMKTSEDLELLKLYKRAGIDIVIIGAEAGSDYELRLYEKHASLEDNYRTARQLQALDLFYVLVGFIMFGPNSTPETLRSNMEFLHKHALADNLMLVANVLMLIKDSKLYHMLKAEGRVIDAQHYWELPRYTFKDKRAETLASHWQNLFARFPATLEVNKLQVNTGNLVYRMTNSMNAQVLAALHDEYQEFKRTYKTLTGEFSSLQYEYFLSTLAMVENGCAPQALEDKGKEFFGSVYRSYQATYAALYNGFINKIIGKGFGLSGLVFKHFHSAMAMEVTERIETGTNTQ